MSAEIVFFESLERIVLDDGDADEYALLAVHEVRVGVGKATVAVRFSRESAAKAFAERFADALSGGIPTAVAHAVDFAGEAYLWVAPERARRWPRPIADEQLVFFADTLVFYEYFTTSADIGFHAAVVADDTSLIAIVGYSTAGKTTTALAATRCGFSLYSDERCIIAGGLVVPHLRAITVREGGRALLLAHPVFGAPMDDLLRGLPPRHEYAFRPSTLLGDLVGGTPRPLAAVFVIEGRDRAPQVEPCTLYDILPVLLKSMASRETGLDRTIRLERELRGVRLFRLRIGAPVATVSMLRNVMASDGFVRSMSAESRSKGLNARLS